jgi:hypothetical protein
VRRVPAYKTVTCRPWRGLDSDVLREKLQSSRLCRPVSWLALSVNDPVQLYNTELTCALDDLMPARTVRVL